jgi:ribosomal protein S18 acetylase RimI-like enzyme
MIRAMKIEDYPEVISLWKQIQGFVLRSVDDSEEGIGKFLERNPTTSVVAVMDGKIVGSVLCGHDGRQGILYHVCVGADYRLQGIGKKMVAHAVHALKEEGISKASIIAFRKNSVGNLFWKELGWSMREDLNYYSYVLNKDNLEEMV